MKPFLLFLFYFYSMFTTSQTTVNYQKVSEDLLLKIKSGKNYTKEVELLSKSTLNDLENQINTDTQKVAFWVNIYNAFIQISLSDNPKLYENKGKFFSSKRVEIADEKLSFDDIEHGILRKSRMKISLGYLRKWFRPKWERKLRIDGKIDWRIHFALNCGGKSCPPVAIYSNENLDEQLDYMTTAYLKEQTTYDGKTKTATSSVLMSWFRGDFGGKSGAWKILFDYKITSEKPKKLKFGNYNWTLDLGNFKEIPKM